MADGLIIRGIFSRLTPAEKLYLMTHPHHVGIIQEIRDKASIEASRLFPREGQHNGEGDAFRHCFASALLARDLGAQNARTFTNAHEAYSANPPRERAMDLHNNGVGIRIGTNREGTSDPAISRLCMAAFDAGELMTVPPASGQRY